MCCNGPTFDSSQSLTATDSFVSLPNITTSRFVIRSMDKKLLDTDQDNGSISRERSSVEEKLQIENMLFSNTGENMLFADSYYSRSLLSPLFARTVSINSSTFEPTPLTEVLPQLYLGTEQDAQQAERLIGLGITHIISIVGGGRYKDLYPKHIYIPLRDNGSSNLVEELENSYEFTMESQEPGNKLFIHCKLGQNRSASFVIGFLMKTRNLSLYEAYTFLKEKRKLIHPHKKYIQQLRQLDLKLNKVYSTPENFLDIVFSSNETLKIMHYNFSKVDSELYKRSQIVHLKEDENYSSSQSSLLGQEVRNGDTTQLLTSHLPDFEFSESSS